MNIANLSHNKLNETKIYNFVQERRNSLPIQYKAAKNEVLRIAALEDFCADSVIIAANIAKRTEIQAEIWRVLYSTSLDCSDAEVSQFELVRTLRERLATYIAEHREHPKHLEVAAELLSLHF